MIKDCHAHRKTFLQFIISNMYLSFYFIKSHQVGQISSLDKPVACIH